MYKDIYTPLQIQMLLQPVFADYNIKRQFFSALMQRDM